MRQDFQSWDENANGKHQPAYERFESAPKQAAESDVAF
jgi:hypothetical protein